MIPADAPVWLRAVQFTVLPKRARRHGIRPVIRYVMRTVGYLARSRPRLGLRFAKSNFRLDWLLYAAMRLSRAPPLAQAA